jgi:hypothetical protein
MFEYPMPATPASPAARSALAAHADAIRMCGRRVVSEIAEIGQHLTEAKALVSHGGWLPWLEREFKWTDETARRFMNVYEASKSHNLLDLDIPLSGLYLLAAPSTPRGAVNEVINNAKNGEKVTVADVKSAIGQHKPTDSLAQVRRNISLGAKLVEKLDTAGISKAEQDAMRDLANGSHCVPGSLDLLNKIDHLLTRDVEEARRVLAVLAKGSTPVPQILEDLKGEDEEQGPNTTETSPAWLNPNATTAAEHAAHLALLGFWGLAAALEELRCFDALIERIREDDYDDRTGLIEAFRVVSAFMGKLGVVLKVAEPANTPNKLLTTGPDNEAYAEMPDFLKRDRKVTDVEGAA